MDVLPSPGSRAARRLVKNKRVPLQTIVLRTLFAAGIISTALIAPNAVRLFAYADRPKAHRKKFYDRVAQAVWRLERRGLIVVEEKNGKRVTRITEKGKIEIQRILLWDYKIPEPALWDGKWRILIFDIREDRRRAREMLRTFLTRAGFLHLQDSVWIYPYPCDEFVTLVRAHLKSGVGEVRVIIAETIEADKELRKHFNVS